MDFVGIRKAIPTEKVKGGRTVCHYCGHCMQGCEVDSKYTSANTPIPRALKTGKLTLFLQTMMTRIVTDSSKSKVTGIEFLDAKGQPGQLRCRTLVLSCSAVETARQLLVNGPRKLQWHCWPKSDEPLRRNGPRTFPPAARTRHLERRWNGLLSRPAHEHVLEQAEPKLRRHIPGSVRVRRSSDSPRRSDTHPGSAALSKMPSGNETQSTQA